MSPISVIMAEVTGLTSPSAPYLHDGRLSYDTLIVARVHHQYFGHDDWRHAPRL
jgi:hypothetical protein